jgi:hypothetical protein
MPTDGYSFPYVAGWAGEHADKAIRETQARVNMAAQAIIAESSAEHTVGAKPPGADLALGTLRQAEAEAATQRSQREVKEARGVASEAQVTTFGGPEVV